MNVVITTITNYTEIINYVRTLRVQRFYLNSKSAFYTWYKYPREIKKLVIAQQNKIILGVALRIKKYNNNILGGWGANSGIYVKSSYRRQGIGSKLLLELSKNTLCTFTSGINRSEYFFYKHNNNSNVDFSL